MNPHELLDLLRELQTHLDDQAAAFARWATTPLERRGPATRTIPLDGEAVLKALALDKYIKALERGA